MNMTTPWIKAAASGGGSQCVEMRRSGPQVQIRDSKDVEGPSLSVSPGQAKAWFDAARSGEFDQLRG